MICHGDLSISKELTDIGKNSVFFKKKTGLSSIRTVENGYFRLYKVIFEG